MKIICDINGNKKYEDDDGNPVELTSAELEIAELSNAGGEVNADDVLDILQKYK